MSEVFNFGYEVKLSNGTFVFKTAEAARVFEKFIKMKDKIIKDSLTEEEVNLLLEHCPTIYQNLVFEIALAM